MIKEYIALWFTLSIGYFIYHTGESIITKTEIEWEELFKEFWFTGVGVLSCYYIL